VKGTYETEPKPLVEEILLAGNEGGYIVSSSCPILDTKEGREQTQPPHTQAKKCYQRYLDKTDGAKFLVTMEEPNATRPEPLEFKVEAQGLSLASAAVSAASLIISKPAPRAG
jgi:hypothetical protein